MNEEDKKRFARYRPGYKEPPPPLDNEQDIKKSEKVKDTLGFVEKIEIDPDDLISQGLSEMENSKTGK
jgi:hypothetical protein